MLSWDQLSTSAAFKALTPEGQTAARQKYVDTFGDTILEEEAGKTNLNPQMLKSVKQAESGGKVDELSSAGAVGPMQFMPATARGEGIDPYNPEQNLRGGAQYLRKLTDKFGGSLVKGLVAYNWGEGNLRKLLASPRGTNWLEHIPPETKAYIDRVTKLTAQGARLGQAAPVALETPALRPLLLPPLPTEGPLSLQMRIAEQGGIPESFPEVPSIPPRPLPITQPVAPTIGGTEGTILGAFPREEPPEELPTTQPSLLTRIQQMLPDALPGAATQEQVTGDITPPPIAAIEPVYSPQKVTRLGPTGRTFDLGNGQTATELSITVTDPRLNQGKPTNIPLLTPNQLSLDELAQRVGKGGEPTREEENRAIMWAAQRGGFPAFNTIEEAVAAAQQRTAEKGKMFGRPQGQPSRIALPGVTIQEQVTGPAPRPQPTPSAAQPSQLPQTGVHRPGVELKTAPAEGIGDKLYRQIWGEEYDQLSPDQQQEAEDLFGAGPKVQDLIGLGVVPFLAMHPLRTAIGLAKFYLTNRVLTEGGKYWGEKIAGEKGKIRGEKIGETASYAAPFVGKALKPKAAEIGAAEKPLAIERTPYRGGPTKMGEVPSAQGEGPIVGGNYPVPAVRQPGRVPVAVQPQALSTQPILLPGPRTSTALPRGEVKLLAPPMPEPGEGGTLSFAPPQVQTGGTVSVRPPIRGAGGTVSFLPPIVGGGGTKTLTPPQVEQGKTQALPPPVVGEGGTQTTLPTDMPPWVDEFQSIGGVIYPDNTVTLYHATTKEKARQILKDGKLRRPPNTPDAYGVYLSSSPDIGQEYGDGTVLPVQVRIQDLHPDDVFPGQRMDFSIPTVRGIYQPLTIGKQTALLSPSPFRVGDSVQPKPGSGIRPTNSGRILAVNDKGWIRTEGSRKTYFNPVDFEKIPDVSPPLSLGERPPTTTPVPRGTVTPSAGMPPIPPPRKEEVVPPPAMPPVPSEQQAKEPWEMTREQYADSEWGKLVDAGKIKDSIRREQNGIWQKFIEDWFDKNEQAYIEGKPVPDANKPWWALTAEAVAARSDDTLNDTIKAVHKTGVARALREGKPVPPEVLADYPDLQREEAALGAPVAEQSEGIQPPLQPPSLTPQDIHAAADAADIRWDNNPAFLAWSETLTSEPHLDRMSPDQLQTMKEAIERGERPVTQDVQKTRVTPPLPQPTTPEPPQQSIPPVSPPLRVTKEPTRIEQALQAIADGKRPFTKAAKQTARKAVGKTVNGKPVETLSDAELAKAYLAKIRGEETPAEPQPNKKTAASVAERRKNR